MYCDYCKKSIVDDTVFCPSCGKKISIKGEYENKCTDCGKDVPPDSLFCWNCGADFSEEEAIPSEALNSTSSEIKTLPKFRTLKANKKIIEESTCKNCNKNFTIGEDVNFCENCHSYYHLECWNSSGGCTQPTCREETKICPFCSKEIKKDAVKCKYCERYLDETIKQQVVSRGKLKEASEALTYAIIGIFCLGIILGPIAISKANKAIARIDREPGWQGRGNAQAAIIIGWIEIIIFVLAIIGRMSSI